MQKIKEIFLKNVWPVLLGFFFASIVMTAFEFANSFLFSFPEGFDKNNLEALREFTKNSSWHLYILVFLGWMIGGFVGGFITTKFSNKNNQDLNNIEKIKNKSLKLSIALAILLSIEGWINYLILQDRIIFYIITTLLFLFVTYLGYKHFWKNK